MLPHQIITIFAISIGAIFLAIALFFHLRALPIIPPGIRPRWLLMATLILSFFLGYLFFPLIMLKAVNFPLELLTAAIFLGGGFFVLLGTGLTLQALKQISSLFNELRRSNNELVEAYDITIEGWGLALEMRDKETEGHTHRVAAMTLKMAEKFAIPAEQLINIKRGALLHDIGKMAIPDRILLKEGPLTDEERQTMQRHPVHAMEMLNAIPYLRPALDIPYCHHERWDGSGYPQGLKGEDIPLAARIFAVADTWDALINARRYHEAWPSEKLCKHIKERAGSHFDPEVVARFLEMDWCRDNKCLVDG